MDLAGLTIKILMAAEYIYMGRNGFATDGEHESDPDIIP
jgi:hypothetical protein